MKRYDTYKDSGVQWLGEIPGHWGCVPLKYLGTCQNGVSKGGDYFGEGFPFVSYSDAYKNMILPTNVFGLARSSVDDRIAYSVEKGDVLFTRTSETIDEIGFASTCLETIKDSVFAGFLIRFRPNVNTIIPEYYKYYFRSVHLRKFFTKKMNIVIRASLSQQLLGQLKVLIPSLYEQKSISLYLDKKCYALDEWVTKKQKEVEHLQELKQRVIADAVTRGLNPQVKMKATNIPWIKDIPEHWEMKRSKYLLRLLTESTKRTRKIGLENIESNTGKYILTESFFDGNGVDFDCGDILYGKLRPYLNKVWLAEFDGNAVGDFYVYRAINGYFNSFAKYLLMSSCFVGISNASTYGTKMPRVSSQFIHSLHFPVPPLSEQKQIVSYLDAKCSKIDKLIANITKEIECIKEYQQRLISDVVTGQIKVC